MAGEATPELTRVLFVDHVEEMGGAQHSLLLLARGLRARGFEPHAVLPSAQGALGQALESSGVMAHEAPDLCVLRRDDPRVLLRLVRGRGQLARIVRTLDPHIVHANGDMAMAFAAGLAGGPWRVVWHVRDLRGLGPLGRYLARRSHLRIAASRSVAERYGFGPSEQDVVIPNGVDLERFRVGLPREPIRETLGIAPDRVVCLCIGQDVPWKRLDDFADLPGASYERILVAFPPPGGAGGQRQFGPRPGLHVLPYRDDIDLVYAAADILVHCAEQEAFGRTIVEAMACGLPVVAVRAGGPAEIVEDGVSGLLVPPRDPGALSRAVAELAGDAELRSRLGAAARRRAEQFSAERHVEAVAEAYRTMLTGTPR